MSSFSTHIGPYDFHHSDFLPIQNGCADCFPEVKKSFMGQTGPVGCAAYVNTGEQPTLALVSYGCYSPKLPMIHSTLPFALRFLTPHVETCPSTSWVHEDNDLSTRSVSMTCCRTYSIQLQQG